MHRHQITDPETISQFIYGGKSTFTLVSVATGTRFTYKLIRANGDKSGRPWFVKIMTGTDNEHSYTYAGFIDPAKPYDIIQGRKGRISSKAPSVMALAWVLKTLNYGGYSNLSKVEVWHEGRCGACGRKLTVPESISTGLGPVCAGRMAPAKAPRDEMLNEALMEDDGNTLTPESQLEMVEREMHHMEAEADRAQTEREELNKRAARDIRELYGCLDHLAV